MYISADSSAFHTARSEILVVSFKFSASSLHDPNPNPIMVRISDIFVFIFFTSLPPLIKMLHLLLGYRLIVVDNIHYLQMDFQDRHT